MAAGKRRNVSGTTTRRVTINDVAEAAGVSITTVSHALNGKGRISQETRERVSEVAMELGYRPSASARSLAGGRSGIIGLNISITTGQGPETFGTFQYYNEMLNAATAEAFNRGYSLIAIPDREEEIPALVRIAPEGLIVIDPSEGNPIVDFARRSGTPVVTTGRVTDGEEYWVDNDHYEGAMLAFEHLEAAGSRRIALIGPPVDRSYIEDITAAYRDWCAERKLDPLIAEAESQSEADGEKAALKLLGGRGRPDAIYALIDSLGLGVIRAARERSISIPDELRLVALTESPFCEKATPSVTTLNLNPARIAEEAVRALADRIEGRPFDPKPSASVPVELIVRESSGAAAAYA